MYAYEKAVLKTYKQTEAFIKSTERAIVKAGFASYYSKKPVDKIADELIDMHVQKAELEAFKEALDQTVSELKPCYREALASMYGLDGTAGDGGQRDSGFYRRVAYALGKFALGMKRRGYNNSVYQRLCEGYSYLNNSYLSTVKFEEGVKKCGNLKNKGKSLKVRKKLTFKGDEEFKAEQ